MDALQLKRLLKAATPELNEHHQIRLHRAISWLKWAEEHNTELDMRFIAYWVSFNACYAFDDQDGGSDSEKERFSRYITQLVELDTEQRFYYLLWDKFSGSVRVILENEFLYKPFWDTQSNPGLSWKGGFNKSIANAYQYLSDKNIPKLLGLVLERLYTLRNQLLHGGSTCNSRVNRKQLRDACQLLSYLMPLIIEIMLLHPGKDWGKIMYPVVVI